MIYMPYLLSRQKEGFCISRACEFLKPEAQVIPIIEPLMKNWHIKDTGLPKWLEAGRKALLVINPYQKQFKGKQDVVSFEEFNTSGILKSSNVDDSALLPTLLIHEKVELDDIEHILSVQPVKAVVHCRMMDDRKLLKLLETQEIEFHVFDVDVTHNSYRKRFSAKSGIVLLRDAFIKKTSNRLYSETPYRFHELPWLAEREQADGFSDYLIETKEFKDGPSTTALAAAIHVSYVIPEEDSVWMQHFVGGPIEDAPRSGYAQLFLLAAEKLVAFKKENPEIWLESHGMRLLEDAYQKEQSISPGDVKEYALLHHLEMMHRLAG